MQTPSHIPKVSIAIPAYNRSFFLRQALHTCLAQTERDIEVLVCDDCSTENLREIVGSLSDERVHYIRNSQRLGAVANHNRAVYLARGEYVIILHSDDLLFPDCVREASAELERRPWAAAVYFSQTYLIDGHVSGSHPMPCVEFADKRTMEEHRWLEKFHGINPSCCLFRKRMFDRIGGFREALRLAYDYDLYIRFVLQGGGVKFMPRILCIYRQHSEQSIRTSSLDGFRDVLSMWQSKVYSHWTRREVALVALNEMSAAVRRRHSPMTIIVEIGRKRQLGKLACAILCEVFLKVVRRSGHSEKKTVGEWRAPADVQASIETGQMIVSTLS